MTEPAVWRVVVAREIDPEARRSLVAAGITHVSGHGLPGMESNSLLVQASSEEEARGAVAAALGGDVVIREARMMPVYVYAPIEPAARTAFEDAAGEDERVGGVIEDESTGQLEAYFELPGGGVDRAFNQARGLYERIVEQAGLTKPEGLEMRMSGFEALMAQATRDRELLDRARDLLERDEFELAVILAQTACEVLIADAIRSLLQRHASDALHGWFLETARSFNLMDRSTQDLWLRLTGAKVQQAELWDGYVAHVRRRNRIVHRGERVESAAATASVAAATEMFSYIERTAAAAPPPT